MACKSGRFRKRFGYFWVWISEIIWADADAGSLFLREGGIPEAQKFSSSQLALYGWSSLFGKKLHVPETDG